MPPSPSILPALARIELPVLPAQPCPYLPDRAMRVRAFKARAMLPSDYHVLMNRGFRRTGTMVYAPACEGCSACIPLRVPVSDFTPSKSQRRVQRRNADVQVTVHRPEADDATFALYRRYVAYQHGDDAQRQADHDERDDDSADNADASDGLESFRQSFVESCVDTYQINYALGGELIAFSIVDACEASLSAVYHAFDPDHARRSLGVFSALTEIALARSMSIPHYYLGYWIAQSPAMAYKATYRPHEVLVDGVWTRQ